MSKIFLVAATQFEILPALQYFDEHFTKKSFFEYIHNEVSIFPVVTGVGAMMTSMAIARTNNISSANLIINAGIAGSFNDKFAIGSVVEVTWDRFADLGVEESDGRFTDVYELELMNENTFPFDQGWIKNPPKTNLPKASALTVNKVHGSQESIDLIKGKYDADIETMEGAGAFYAAKILDIDIIQIRAISNMVEPRNKDNWNIELAISKLNEELIRFITN